ncbi:hypothetical protein B5F40_13120 [Gordonibacter sp. An230]|uniref:hypothetical protein n=1 Tax=Gordonibacter sp. An230 TaxID=1965592 RepID=UPI000B391DAB|nr:hypothetical protein [Gordonibacter sp. An230]OUO88000.1 hypothetical protein B5F40_13120 [Gordonibacter sp. An230]
MPHVSFRASGSGAKVHVFSFLGTKKENGFFATWGFSVAIKEKNRKRRGIVRKNEKTCTHVGDLPSKTENGVVWHAATLALFE